MSRTVTAFFDSRAEAEAARERLSQSSIDADNVRIVDKETTGSGGSTGSEGQGFWASVKSAFLPEEDSHAYEEGMRRGGYLLCAQVDEQRADEAIRVLEESDSVDFDSREQLWRGEGWPGFAGTEVSGSGGRPAPQAAFQGDDASFASAETDRTVAEERIPIMEEQIRVGKREVARGGARVRSYVSETPFHEQVNLREEHVSVERRPVDERIAPETLGTGDFLKDRTVEMTETAEEAVVAKEARVREELVLRKTAEERTEQVDDTLRHTEVEVEDLQGGGDRSAFGGFGGGSGGSGTGSAGTGSTASGGTSGGSFDADRETEGTGYDPRIDKTGL